MKKILIVFDGLGLGGTERVGLNYIKIFKKLGFDINILNLLPKNNLLLKSIDPDIKIYNVYYPQQLTSEYFSKGLKRWRWWVFVYPLIVLLLVIVEFVYRIIFMIKFKKYDLTIAFSGHFNDLSVVSKKFIRSNKKIAWLHGSLKDYLLISYCFGEHYSRIKNLVVLSNDSEMNALHFNPQLSNCRLTKIYNPIIPDGIIDKMKVNSLYSKYGDYLLMVGRFTKEKDQRTVVLAYNYLKNKYRITNKLVFVGDGDTKFMIEDIVSELNLTDSVFFEGSNKNVGNYYSSAKLFIHSSPSEGLPTVILEAMYYGVPVVATNSLPGVKEICGNNEYALVSEVGDYIELAHNIQKMLVDPDLYSYYKEKGLIRIKEFSEEYVSKKLDEYIMDIK